MLELREGFIAVLDTSMPGLVVVVAVVGVAPAFVVTDDDKNSGFSCLLIFMGGVSVSKFENGKIAIGVVFEEVHVSVFKMVLVDEDDEEDDIVWQDCTV